MLKLGWTSESSGFPGYRYGGKAIQTEGSFWPRLTRNSLVWKIAEDKSPWLLPGGLHVQAVSPKPYPLWLVSGTPAALSGSGPHALVVLTPGTSSVSKPRPVEL